MSRRELRGIMRVSAIVSFILAFALYLLGFAMINAVGRWIGTPILIGASAVMAYAFVARRKGQG
jgi:hypothetical protein